MRHQNGFTMIELLLCLALSALLGPILVKLLQFQVKFPDQNALRQNQIGILQLRRYLSLGINHEINDDRICMNYKDEDFCFYQNENSLIGTPGTQFFLVDVQNVVFYVEEKWLMISFESGNRAHKYQLLYDAKF